MKNTHKVMIKDLHALLLKHKLRVGVAESCTGGALSSAFMSQAGSSLYFEGGYITYSNEAKIKLLNIDKALIETYGAVSKEVVSAMVLAVHKTLNTQASLSISGIAGPGGGSVLKPVGSVYFGFYIPDFKKIPLIKKRYFYGNRPLIIAQSVNFTLAYLRELLNKI